MKKSTYQIAKSAISNLENSINVLISESSLPNYELISISATLLKNVIPLNYEIDKYYKEKLPFNSFEKGISQHISCISKTLYGDEALFIFQDDLLNYTQRQVSETQKLFKFIARDVILDEVIKMEKEQKNKLISFDEDSEIPF
ncbi:hypothetical protein JOC95_001626 [Bacillus tianshenii]|uniref:Uncharacterized protein n=1 Tax=Sutcliffiella tianshenii TaxID=1463404 RepID=A0ABS2NYR8_9BACI|nr:hypothetical protein [Bacillus tianshenii]MBM7619774.1 hypothetical protein [Bacillus tianshenii]